jgi:hypothetical protein
MSGVQSLRGHEDFPADCPHRRIFTLASSVGFFTPSVLFGNGLRIKTQETDVPANSQIVPPALPLESPNSRRPPQSNCPPGNVRLPDHGQPLEPKFRKGGISLMTPPRLAPRLQSLPPMLHMRNPSPMPRCSKAPRGLFVQVCVTRVFTGISVSPGPS